jgi:microcystin degradation protein MlrC
VPEFAAGTQSQIDVKLTAQNESRALSAEKLATVASLVDHRWKPSGTVIDSMWDSILLMNEHTWGWGRTLPNHTAKTQ